MRRHVTCDNCGRIHNDIVCECHKRNCRLFELSTDPEKKCVYRKVADSTPRLNGRWICTNLDKSGMFCVNEQFWSVQGVTDKETIKEQRNNTHHVTIQVVQQEVDSYSEQLRQAQESVRTWNEAVTAWKEAYTGNAPGMREEDLGFVPPRPPRPNWNQIIDDMKPAIDRVKEDYCNADTANKPGLCIHYDKNETGGCRHIMKCWHIFGEKLDCQAHPKQKKNMVCITKTEFRKLEVD